MRIPAIKYYFPVFVINYYLIPIVQRIKIENNKQENSKDSNAKNFKIEFIFHRFSNKRVNIINKVKLSVSDNCRSKIFHTFVTSDLWLGSETAQNKRAFFSPAQYDGGLVFVPETGDPDQGSDNGNGHRFNLVAVKNLVKMGNKLLCGKTAPLAISAEKIIHDLVTSDTISNLRSDLKEMLHSYLLQEDDSYSRRKVHASYLTLDMMLQKLETNNKLN